MFGERATGVVEVAANSANVRCCLGPVPPLLPPQSYFFAPLLDDDRLPLEAPADVANGFLLAKGEEEELAGGVFERASRFTKLGRIPEGKPEGNVAGADDGGFRPLGAMTPPNVSDPIVAPNGLFK